MNENTYGHLSLNVSTTYQCGKRLTELSDKFEAVRSEFYESGRVDSEAYEQLAQIIAEIRRNADMLEIEINRKFEP